MFGFRTFLSLKHTHTHTHTHSHTHTHTRCSSFNVENTLRSSVAIRTILCAQFHGIKYRLLVGTQPAPQPREASVHRGHQPSCAAHCQSPQSALPGQDPTIGHFPMAKEGPICARGGQWPRVREMKGGTDRRVCSSWSPQVVLQPTTNHAKLCFSF